MNITQANAADLEAVKNITRTTISEIYPHYYPRGAVEFFLAHHSDERIAEDIAQSRVYLCRDENSDIVGTVTIHGSEILRLFVLPGYQGHGCGRALLDFAESEIAKTYGEVVIDASLPAKPIYLKRGYKEAAYNIIETDNNDRLCYDVMKKTLRAEHNDKNAKK